MRIFFPFPLLIFEIIIFIFLASLFGFIKTFFYYLLPSFVGILIIIFHSRYALISILKEIQSGRSLPQKLIGSSLTLFGALLLLPPLMTTRFIGLLLIIPGLKKICIMIFSNWFSQSNQFEKPQDISANKMTIDVEPISVSKSKDISER